MSVALPRSVAAARILVPRALRGEKDMNGIGEREGRSRSHVRDRHRPVQPFVCHGLEEIAGQDHRKEHGQKTHEIRPFRGKKLIEQGGRVFGLERSGSGDWALSSGRRPVLH